MYTALRWLSAYGVLVFCLAIAAFSGIPKVAGHGLQTPVATPVASVPIPASRTLQSGDEVAFFVGTISNSAPSLLWVVNESPPTLAIRIDGKQVHIAVPDGFTAQADILTGSGCSQDGPASIACETFRDITMVATADPLVPSHIHVSYPGVVTLHTTVPKRRPSWVSIAEFVVTFPAVGLILYVCYWLLRHRKGTENL